MRFNLNKNDVLIGNPSGSDHAMSREFQQFSAMGACFPPLPQHFHCQIRPCKFTRFPRCVRLTCLRDFAMHCFDSKPAFDLLGERQAANRNGFRPASTFREFPNPQWSPENRPMVVRSKPANGSSPRLGCSTSLPPDPASPFWFANCAGRI